MPIPSATAREFQRVARILGFTLTRQKGSQARWNHPYGRAVAISIYAGEEIGPPLFHRILSQLGITLEQFEEMR
ncbi:MAG TPA: type II toxin-antitoxin system HicA family toxin [Candidatus Eisenbacteria bacterium]|nr:type II toxin-antitoxin system HicA family toxin [Candidatus Eisenbacteria bacterium]